LRENPSRTCLASSRRKVFLEAAVGAIIEAFCRTLRLLGARAAAADCHRPDGCFSRRWPKADSGTSLETTTAAFDAARRPIIFSAPLSIGLSPIARIDAGVPASVNTELHLGHRARCVSARSRP
jgi:hypothetical protein